MKEEKIEIVEFEFRKKSNELKVLIQGKGYTFDCSPTNYGFIKKVAELSREVQKIMADFEKTKKDSLFDVEKSFDFIMQKEKAVIDVLMPGKWDELFELAGQDLFNMVELISFVSEKIRTKGAMAKIQSVAAPVPEDAEQV